MEHKTDIQARLQQMIEEEPLGQNAEAALRRLSAFLTERFGGPAIKLFLPGDRHEQLAIIKTLQKWQFIQTSPRTDPRPNANWRDDYWPWDNKYKYWFDPQVIQLFQPSPTDEERHFAFHAARILRFNAGISRNAIDFYLELVDWAFIHKPDIALGFAKELAHRYGGPDPRFYEKVYQAAEALQFIEEQARAIYKLASLASGRQDVALAAQQFRQVLTLGNPQTSAQIAYHHMRSLEYLGKLARAEKDWTQARDFYEKSLVLRESLITENDRPIKENGYAFAVWLQLCHITDMLGDPEAHHMYGEKVRDGRPSGVRDHLPSITSEESGRRDYIRQLEWHTQNRRPRGYILWHWGHFEYSYGHHADGCRLCGLAIIEFEAQFSYVAWGNVGDMNNYSLIRENQELFLKELRIGLANMGCEEC